MARPMTPERFLERLIEVHKGEIVALEPYVDGFTPILFNKLTCSCPPWEHAPNGILKGVGCPGCSGRKTSPEAMKRKDEKFRKKIEEIHKGEIVALSPYINSYTKIKVLKLTCNHGPWDAVPSSLLLGHGCDACAREEVAKNNTDSEDDFQSKLLEARGGEIIALEPYKDSQTEILFKKVTCDCDPWLARPKDILYGANCPGCNPRKPLTSEEFQARLREAHQGKVIAIGEFKTVKDKLLFQNVECGHPPWLSEVDSVLRGSGCPYCSESKGERFTATILEKQAACFERQKVFPDCKHHRLLPFDFCVKLPDGKLVLIEVDGIFHREVVEGLTTEKDLKLQQKRDRIKDEYCKKNGHTLIRIPYYGTETLDDMRKILFATVGPLLGWKSEVA